MTTLPGQKTGALRITLSVTLLMLLTGGILYFGNVLRETPAQEPVSVKVLRDDLVLKIFERGLVAPARVVPVQSTISSNQALLVWLLDEGTAVTKNQLIARFDTKPFVDKLERLEQERIDLDATITALEKAVAMKKASLQGQVDAARRRLEIATINQDDLLNGSGPLRLRSLEKNIVQAERNLAILTTTLDDMDMLLVKGHVSRRERDRTANDVATAREALELATAELENFTRYEWPRLQHEARLGINAANEELAKEKLTLTLETQRLEGELVKLSRDLTAATERRNEARREVAACEIRAPIAGTLLYRDIPRNDGRRKVQIGDAIWFGQSFMEIPDTSEMVIDLHIREIDVAKIHQGTNAVIALDALPGYQFSGRVEFIDALARDDDNQGIRTFRTRILLDDTTQRIYPGMSASVQILYDHLEQVLLLPLDALTYHADKITARLDDHGTHRDIVVEVEHTGSGKAVITSGLNEGDQVLMKGL